MPLEPLPKELQAEYIAKALESSAPISILGYGVTTKPIVAFLNALGKACAIYDDKGKNVDSSGGGVENVLLHSREFCADSSVLEILSPGIPPDHKYFGGAKKAISEYDFIWWLCGDLASLVDSALLKKPAAAPPCTASLVFSSQILESCAEMDKQTSATPRICEEDNRAECERSTQPLESTFGKTPQLSSQADETLSLSSRADKVGVAIHKSTQVDSKASAESMDCHANATAFARNDDKNAESQNAVSLEKVDSRENAANLKTPQNAGAENVFCSQADRRQDCKNLESTFDTAATLSEPAKDSRIFTQNAQNLTTQQAAGFCDDFAGCQGVGEGIYLGDNEQAHTADSRKSAQKPTPHTQIWISGTNGKTTTTQMLELLLSPYGARAGGNIGTPLITLYEQNTPLWILETSSFALHYTRTATPAIYALLPLSPDHISWHNGFENYVCDKLSPLARMGADSVAILPSDLRDHRLCQAFLGEKIFYTDSSDLRAYLLAQGFEPNALDTLPFFEPFLLDAYVALCCAFALSRKCPSIAAAGFIPTLASFTIGAHRVEEFYVCAFGAEWLFVDDSKGTNIDATLKAIARYKDRALFLILGGDDKGTDMQEIFTLLAGLKRVEIFTIGTNEPKLLDLAARHSVKAHKCGTLDRAMEKIWAMIAESSTRLAQDFVCLLSPAAASLDQFSSYKERGELFKTLAKELANRH